jgi:hypothetical protein
MYLLPAYPTTISGWLLMIGASLPYVLALGISAGVLRESWAIGGWRLIVGAMASIAAMIFTTVAYFWLCGIL